MGSAPSRELRPQIATDLRIQQWLEFDGRNQGSDIKLAVAGLDMAGKKTILRQIKRIFDQRFEDMDSQQYTQIIHENIVAAMKKLVVGVRRLHEFNTARNEATKARQLDEQKIAEQEAADKAAALAADEESDEDSSSDVTEDTDEEAEAEKAAEEAAEEAKKAAEAAAAEKEAQESAAKNSDDSSEDDEDEDEESSEEESEPDSEEGGATKPGTDELEEGMERLPNLKKLDNFFRVVEMYESDERVSFEHVDVFTRLWNSWEMQETYRLRHCLQLHIQCDIQYFMNNLQDIAAEDYVPVHEAIIRIPGPPPASIIDVREIQHVNYTMIDLSTQSNKMSKWMHMLSNLSSLIFVVAIDEYDIQMEHDATLNRITESAKLLRTIMENKTLHNKRLAKFLWFNKFDRFSEKIKQVDIRNQEKRRFLDYNHGKCVCTDSLSKFGRKCTCRVQKRALDYIKEKFLGLLPELRNQFRVQLVEGLDRFNVQTNFSIARDVMLKKTIYGLGDWV